MLRFQDFSGLVSEMRRVVWPTRPEWVSATVLTIVLVAAVSLFTYGVRRALDVPLRLDPPLKKKYGRNCSRHRRPRSPARTAGAALSPRGRPAQLVRHPHLLGLREQGEGEPRAPHPLDEHAGQDLPRARPDGRRSRVQRRQAQDHAEEGLPGLRARRDDHGRPVVVRRAQHAGRHRLRRQPRPGREAAFRCKKKKSRRSSSRWASRRPKLKIDFKKGDRVKVTSGPFFDFTGVVDEIQPEKEKVCARSSRSSAAKPPSNSSSTKSRRSSERASSRAKRRRRVRRGIRTCRQPATTPAGSRFTRGRRARAS